MPVQTQQASFAKKLGGRVAQANQEHKDKPIDTGMIRLPAGIKNGIARLQIMVCKEYPDDKNGPGTKGQTFFRAAAVVVSPDEFAGQRLGGIAQTSQVIPLCDIPAKGMRKAKSFSDNWFEFQNLFKLLGINPPNETPQTDPTGQKTEAYYFAAMKTLCNPQRPVFISFSTRGWVPPATPLKPNPEEMVFETWHGLAKFDATVDPAAGVTVAPSANGSSHDDAPAFNEMTPPAPEPPNRRTSATTKKNAPKAPEPEPEPDQSNNPTDPEERSALVESLVEVAMNDPDGETEDGQSAAAQLEDMAWEMGWTDIQTANAKDWAHVGHMALNAPEGDGTEDTDDSGIEVVVGSQWLFAKRDKSGNKLKNNKGEEFPPQQVEVVTVDATAGTCTLKTVKDNKDVVDVRTKRPVAVKFEWLEVDE